jgi:hypothetical protein
MPRLVVRPAQDELSHLPYRLQVADADAEVPVDAEAQVPVPAQQQQQQQQQQEMSGPSPPAAEQASNWHYFWTGRDRVRAVSRPGG